MNKLFFSIAFSLLTITSSFAKEDIVNQYEVECYRLRIRFQDFQSYVWGVRDVRTTGKLVCLDEDYNLLSSYYITLETKIVGEIGWADANEFDLKFRLFDGHSIKDIEGNYLASHYSAAIFVGIEKTVATNGKMVIDSWDVIAGVKAGHSIQPTFSLKFSFPLNQNIIFKKAKSKYWIPDFE